MDCVGRWAGRWLRCHALPRRIGTAPGPQISRIEVDDDEAARALEWEACIGSVAACNLGEVSPVSATGVNVYDVRVPCGDMGKLCYDFSAIDAYLNQPDVQAALGVSYSKKGE